MFRLRIAICSAFDDGQVRQRALRERRRVCIGSGSDRHRFVGDEDPASSVHAHPHGGDRGDEWENVFGDGGTGIMLTAAGILVLGSAASPPSMWKRKTMITTIAISKM